jgi:nitroreductase
MNTNSFLPLNPAKVSPHEVEERTRSFYEQMQQRRSVRFFSDQAVDKKVIEHLILTAGTAPSGAHKQPWTFCAVSNPTLKTAIREAAEKEEYLNYHGRMSDDWLKDLSPLGTDWQKPFLEIAPWLIVVFKKAWEQQGAERQKCYYVSESVGIATGILLAAIHHAGLVALTHTPSPMNFLQDLLKRPDNERPFLLIPVGYPAADAVVPNLHRKELDEIAFFY